MYDRAKELELVSLSVAQKIMSPDTGQQLNYIAGLWFYFDLTVTIPGFVSLRVRKYVTNHLFFDFTRAHRWEILARFGLLMRLWLFSGTLHIL